MQATKTTPEARRNTPEIVMVGINEQTATRAITAFVIAEVTAQLREEQHGHEGKENTGSKKRLRATG